VSRAIAESDALHARVQAGMARGADRGEWQALALDVAAFQIEHVEPVARLSRARLGDRAPRSIDEIAALPTDVFRLRRVAAHGPELDARVFRTSGTSEGAAARGSHAFRTLATYEAGALHAARPLLLGDPRPTRAVLLTPSAQALPDSSLSFMVDLFMRELGISSAHAIDESFGLNIDGAIEALTRAELGGEPTIVLGTAFAYVFLLDALAEQRFRLAPGSRLMLTGGFKGRTREVPESELRERLSSMLGLPASQLVGEYGMTELSSQLYEPRLLGESIADGTYRPPPWLFVSAADPTTLEPLPQGARGVARFIDVANVDSSIGVQTMDLVEVQPNGDVRLFGRAPGASARGCSLTVEEIFGAKP
jgi:hypothetical protein